MNTNYSDSELYLMDKFLEDLFNEKSCNNQIGYFMAKFDCEKDEAQFIIKSICVESESGLNLVKFELFQNNTWYDIIGLNLYECDKFINDGGFRNHFLPASLDKESKSHPIAKQAKAIAGKVVSGIVIMLGILVSLKALGWLEKIDLWFYNKFFK